MVGLGLVAILSGATFYSLLLHGSIFSSLDFRNGLDKKGPLLSNGTHLFKRTVLLVSIDGMRADYLDRGLTPNLVNVAKKGVKAKSLMPIFPSLTYPNHWALITGLHAESHGIVANDFWDPISQTEFHYNVPACWMNSSYWWGEPMWETAERAGLLTANLMWPGPPATSSGIEPAYYVPWRNDISLGQKHDQIMQWIDQSFEERPSLILAYEPSLDQIGHTEGPNSIEIDIKLKEVDKFVKKVQTSLASRHLTDIVDVIYVSDHGMADTTEKKLIFLDDILGEGFKDIEHIDGWPAYGLRLADKANVTYHLATLREAAHNSGGTFVVETHDTMPKRWHFSNGPRVAPIYIIPTAGYVITDHVENGSGVGHGTHGYDNIDPAMHGIFVAHGAFTKRMKARLGQSNPMIPKVMDGWDTVTRGARVMDTFQNVEIYNLVMRLLDIRESAAPNNGSIAFWDRYM